MLFILLGALCALGSCKKESKDMGYPEILVDSEKTCPLDCEVYQRGGVIHFYYTFKDDTELGAFNIEIHNNFDHHTHSTSAVECDMDEKKEAKSAWVYNQDFSIPAGSRLYTAQVDIPIPQKVVVEYKDPVTQEVKDSLMDMQGGDYHFMIRLTDKAGWQQLHAVGIKIE